VPGRATKGKSFSLTVCGEWFPEVYPAGRSRKWSRGDEDPVRTEMRLFCACERWAFNRLAEGLSRDEIKKRGQQLFGLNSRYVDDALLRAGSLLESRKELLALEVEETEKKLARARKKLGHAERELGRAERRGGPPEELHRLRLTVKGRQARVASLEGRLAELRAHRERGTIPRVVFGGRALWRRVCRGRASREEWRAARRNRLYARGDGSKGGNPNVKVSCRDGEFRLSVTVSHLSEQVGVDRLGRPKMSPAPRVAGRLWLPEKHRDAVRTWVAVGLPYAVELIRWVDGRYRAHLIFDLGAVPVADFSGGCLAVDTNPDGVGLCNVGRGGQPDPWPRGLEIPYPANLGKYEGEFRVVRYPNGFMYLRVPDLGYASSARRKYLIGVVAKVVADIAAGLGKSLVLEDLDFGKDSLDTDGRFNRMASNFPYAEMVEAVCRRARKEGVGCTLVPCQHTSTVGYWKYKERYAVPVHCAAALVIGRRAMGYDERVGEELRRRVAVTEEKLGSKGIPLPVEGEGMTRRVRATSRRLDGKLLCHNGLARWQKDGFYSVWHDLRELALALR